MEKLKVFVGSSSEAKAVDMQIREIIEDCDVLVRPWRGVFKPGEYGLESLSKISHEVDAAVLIATNDDETWYRGKKTTSPRDNIIFETGLFIRALGRERVGVIVVKNEEGNYPKLPTDMLGLNVIVHDQDKPAKIEHSISKWILDITKSNISTNSLFNNSIDFIKERINTMPVEWKSEIEDFILSPFKLITANALDGRIHLTTGQYYDSINSEMRKANSNTEIRALSLLNPRIWSEDEDQKTYLEANYAAGNNNATIKRLFVVEDQEVPKLSSVISKLFKNNIQVKILSKKRFYHFHPKLKDCVIINDNGKLKNYVSNRDLDSSKLRGGELYLQHYDSIDKIEEFDKFWELGNIKSIGNKIKKDTKIILDSNPPGQLMKSFGIKKSVVSCENAAKERGVPLANELKTLILYSTRYGLVAVHLPGDGTLSLRKVKNALESRDVCLADPEDLYKFGENHNTNITAGTVCAVLNPVWSMHHLISRRLLSLEYVTTNNGTKTAFFKFEPWILLKARSVLEGDFEK